MTVDMAREDWLVDGEFQILRRRVGPLDNSSYLLACPETKEAVLIDAADEASVLIEAVGDFQLVAILETHGHYDHWQALAELSRRFPRAWVGAHPSDLALFPKPPPGHSLADQEEVRFGRRSLRVVHTPGHTPGSVCFLIPGFVFTGDTLFPGGPGATQPPLGDYPTIAESIRTRLFTLPDLTVAYPGHGLETTLGREKASWGDRLPLG